MEYCYTNYFDLKVRNTGYRRKAFRIPIECNRNQRAWELGYLEIIGFSQPIVLGIVQSFIWDLHAEHYEFISKIQEIFGYYWSPFIIHMNPDLGVLPNPKNPFPKYPSKRNCGRLSKAYTYPYITASRAPVSDSMLSGCMKGDSISDLSWWLFVVSTSDHIATLVTKDYLSSLAIHGDTNTLQAQYADVSYPQVYRDVRLKLCYLYDVWMKYGRLDSVNLVPETMVYGYPEPFSKVSMYDVCKHFIDMTYTSDDQRALYEPITDILSGVKSNWHSFEMRQIEFKRDERIRPNTIKKKRII